MGRTTQATATPLDAHGALVPGQYVAWSSGSPQRATVDANGVITPVGLGGADIIATVNGTSGDIVVYVIMPSPNYVVVTLDAPTVHVGQSVAGHAIAYDVYGQPFACSIAWTSSPAGVARVSNTGLITGVSPGAAVITGGCGISEINQSVHVTVLP